MTAPEEMVFNLPAFIGRDAEQDRLRRALNAALESNGSTFFIAG